jgi:uncharacterized protein YkwD
MVDSGLPGADVPELDKQIFGLQNDVRADPKVLLPDLEEMLKNFDGNLLKREGKVTMRTKEGPDAVK